jgi:predicted dithiol-disulfide oxidoreductase (DUF899 family)
MVSFESPAQRNFKNSNQRRNLVMKTSTVERPKAVSAAEWEAARKELLIKEKQLTRQRDEVDRQRRELPWVKVEKEYVLEAQTARKRSRIFLKDGAN